MSKHMKTETVDGDQVVSGVTVYRTNKSAITITGQSIAFLIVDGTLIVQANGFNVYAFSSGEWLTVNTPPV